MEIYTRIQKMGLCAQWETDISGTDTHQPRMLDKSLQGETHVCIEMSDFQLDISRSCSPGVLPFLGEHRWPTALSYSLTAYMLLFLYCIVYHMFSLTLSLGKKDMEL